MTAVHKIYDVTNCKIISAKSNNVLDVPIAGIILKGLVEAGITVLNHTIHFFPNGGETGCILLAESHFNYHWWVEKQFIAMDFYHCNSDQNDPEGYGYKMDKITESILRKLFFEYDLKTTSIKRYS